MTWVFVAFAVAGAVWWWFYQSEKPYYHRNLQRDRFDWLLRGLAETTKEGAVLLIEHQVSDRFIRFVKTRNAAGMCLGFAFAEAPWSRAYFETLCKALSEHGFDFARSETGDENVPCFVEVEFAGSPTEQRSGAVRVAEIACQVMGLGEEERFTAHVRGELDSASVIQESWRAIRAARQQRK
jgi:hypothetical protein